MDELEQAYDALRSKIRDEEGGRVLGCACSGVGGILVSWCLGSLVSCFVFIGGGVVLGFLGSWLFGFLGFVISQFIVRCFVVCFVLFGLLASNFLGFRVSKIHKSLYVFGK